MQGLSVQNTKSLEKTGQELSSGMSYPPALPAGQDSVPSLTKISFSRSYLRLFSESAWISKSLAPFLSGNQKNSSKSRMFMKIDDSPSITAWTVVFGSFSHRGHELPTRLLLSGLWPSQKSALVNFLL